MARKAREAIFMVDFIATRYCSLLIVFVDVGERILLWLGGGERYTESQLTSQSGYCLLRENLIKKFHLLTLTLCEKCDDARVSASTAHTTYQ